MKLLFNESGGVYILSYGDDVVYCKLKLSENVLMYGVNKTT